MPLAPNSLQTAIIGDRKAYGVKIDSATKSATSSLPPSSASLAAQKSWQAALEVIYTDLDINLTTHIGAFLNTMTVTYAGIPSVAGLSNPIVQMKNFFITDAIKIDNEAKARTSILPPSSTALASQIIYQTALEVIFDRLLDMVPTAVVFALQSAQSIVPAGVAALGVPAPGVTVSPTPALVVPTAWSPATLKTSLTNFFNAAQAKTTSAQIDTKAKAATSNIPPSAVSSAGSKSWEVFSLELTNIIATLLPGPLTGFIYLGNGSAFNVAVGTPLSTPSPPFTATAGPLPQPLGIIT